VELSVDATNWYVVFAWSLGNEALAGSSEISPFAAATADPNYCDLVDGAHYSDLIPMSTCNLWGGLYGTLPLKTGVRIDIGLATPPLPFQPAGFRYIRIQTRPDAVEPAEIDAIERLN
jgi:hypothetical protein